MCFVWSGASWPKTEQYIILLADIHLVLLQLQQNSAKVQGITWTQKATRNISSVCKHYLQSHKPSKAAQAAWFWLVFGTSLSVTSAIQTDFIHGFLIPGKCDRGHNCFLPKPSQSFIHYPKSAKILGARLPRQLNFIPRYLIYVRL